MDTIPAQSTPSQQTGDGLSVLKTGHYLADRRPGTIITCKETPKGEWEQGELKTAIQFSDWQQYDLDPSLFPEGHNIAYKCETVKTRPDLPKAYPVQTLPGFSVSTQSVFTAPDMSPGELTRDINPR